MWVTSNYSTADSNRPIKVSLKISEGATERSKDKSLPCDFPSLAFQHQATQPAAVLPAHPW